MRCTDTEGRVRGRVGVGSSRDGRRVVPCCVYSAEVERVVASHAAVHLAAVYGVPDPSGQFGELVKAVVQLKDGAALTRRELQTHCASHLARYKVPAVVEFVALIPLTGSGKVHKSVLKERETQLKPATAARSP